MGAEEQNIKTEIQIYDEKQLPRKPSLISIPKDKLKIGFVLFFFMGMCHVLPLTFFNAANNFWMYKFRDPQLNDSETSDGTNRTSLQKYFASSSQIANKVPTLLFGVFNILVAYRYAITKRISITLAIQSLIFILLTVFVEVDTDNYQEVFFATVMISYVILASTGTVNMVSSMSLYSRFPREYMIAGIIGESLTGIAGDLINITCIAVFEGDIISSTLVYFIFGSTILITTFCLSVFVTKTEFFQHGLKTVKQDKKKMPSRSELLHVIKILSPVIFVTAFYHVGMSSTHTAITALVVSEQTDTSWAINYFSPIMTFFLGDFALLLGRVISSFLPIKIPEKVFLSLVVLRTLIFVPLIWLCNAQPRDQLPVVFGHDYQYGLIFFIFMITSGYVINYCILFISEKVDKKDADVAYTVYGFILSFESTAFSPIGMFIVNIL